MNWLNCWFKMLRPKGKLREENCLVVAGRRTGKTTHAINWIIEKAMEPGDEPCTFATFNRHVWRNVIVPQMRAMCQSRGLLFGDNPSQDEVTVNGRRIRLFVMPMMKGKAVVVDEPFMSFGGQPTLVVGTPRGRWSNFHLPVWKAATIDLKDLKRIKSEIGDDAYRQDYGAEFL